MSRAAVKPARRIRADVLHGDQHRALGGHLRVALVEHVRVRVDEPRQDRGVAEIGSPPRPPNLHARRGATSAIFSP